MTLNPRQFNQKPGEEQGYDEVHHSVIANAISNDWGVPIKHVAAAAHKAWKAGDLAEGRAADYEDSGGPENHASRVGRGQEHGHTEPIQLERWDENTVHVVNGNHRALDAVQRKLPKVPVEWL